MTAVARTKKLFLMEAMWTRFLPVIRKVRELLTDGVIGDVRMLTADFGFRAEANPGSRLFDPALGGGSLLDVGVYSVAMAFMVFNRTPSALASARLRSGQPAWTNRPQRSLRYDKGEMALLSSAIIAQTANEANIFGRSGSIRIPSFWRAVTATVFAGDKREITIPFRANGYEYEAEEVMRCIAEGRLEMTYAPVGFARGHGDNGFHAPNGALRIRWRKKKLRFHRKTKKTYVSPVPQARSSHLARLFASLPGRPSPLRGGVSRQFALAHPPVHLTRGSRFIISQVILLAPAGLLKKK